jgi:8-oxo-dGTP diphosphatase
MRRYEPANRNKAYTKVNATAASTPVTINMLCIPSSIGMMPFGTTAQIERVYYKSFFTFAQITYIQKYVYYIHYGILRLSQVYWRHMAYVYVAPTLTVDCVIFELIDGKLNVLLIKRATEPFQGQWSLPGGYNAAGNTTLEAVQRALNLKVGLNLADFPLVEQLYTFDTVARDPRGHAVSVSYMCLGHDLQPKLAKSEHEPTFVPIDALPKLAFDHDAVIQYAVSRLRSKVTYTTAMFALLPSTFTLTQLQSAYEAVDGSALDKRNFRKKFLALGVLEPTDEYHQDGAHRPALLYRFKQLALQPLHRDF